MNGFDNYLVLKTRAKSCNEQFLRTAVASFCVGLEPTIEEINDIKTAVSEAVTNCIVHGYEGKDDGEITCNVFLQDKKVTIEVIDFGIGIDDIERAKKPFYTTKSNEERSGMGFC
ncbi:MAG: anti-sigma F factor, partial [Clostridia bacterium]